MNEKETAYRMMGLVCLILAFAFLMSFLLKDEGSVYDKFNSNKGSCYCK